jgi:hypothetical protein
MTKLKHLATTELKKAPVEDSGPATPGPRGPIIGDLTSDATFIALHATPSELQTFRACVEARRARAVPVKLVLGVCKKCGAWLPNMDPEWIGKKCLKCSNNPHIEGGTTRLATPAEIKIYADREAAIRERGERIQFEDDQTNRRKSGLIPFKDIAEWRATRKADWQKKLAHDREVQATWDKVKAAQDTQKRRI